MFFSLLHFLSLTSMYVPNLIMIPFVGSKIWPGQATITKTIFRRDNSIYTGKDDGFVHCPSSHCHVSINQISFPSPMYFLK